MDKAGDVVGRRVHVAQLPPAGGLRHHPLRLRLAVVPAHVIDEVREHVHHPAGRGSIDRVDSPQRAAGDNLFHLLVMRPVAMLVAHDGFHAARFQHVPNRRALGAGQRHRLFHGDQPGPALNSHPNHRGANRRQGAETENVGPQRDGQFTGIRGFPGHAQLGGRRIQTSLVDIADAHDFEPAVGLESGGMVHAALARPDHHHPILVCHAAPAVRSHSMTLPIT